MLSTLAIAGYRSLRNVVVPLAPLSLITGPNGSGKSSLYRALRLLGDTAQGSVIPLLAQEGGLPSTLWAGPETVARSVLKGWHPVQGTPRKAPVSLRLGFAGTSYGYAIDLGLPPQQPGTLTMFKRDPEIKRECIWHGPQLRPSTLLVDRNHCVVRFRASGGEWEIAASNLATFDSVLARLADPRNAPEAMLLRDEIRSWRFYDQFRSDVDAPARTPQVGTHTPVLHNDGRDLPAAIQTIREVGDVDALHAAIEDAFPGSSVNIVDTDGRFALKMQQHGLLRPLDASELSDGTLRYMLWIAALLTPRPPGLMLLNEPETSLHPDLLPALARLITEAARQTQVIVVSHSDRLIQFFSEQPRCSIIRLEKHFGETQIVADANIPTWNWPSR